MMKILLADKPSEALIGDLENAGAEVTSNPDLTADNLPEAIANAAVLVVRSTKVTQATIEAATQLRLIIRAGAGVNTIDLDAASNHGVYVANCPGMNTDAVAELVIGLLISADRGIADATQSMRAGKWQKKRFGKAIGLKTRTMGIVGTGRIGLATAKRAKALEMKVVAWSRSLSQQKADELGVEYAATPAELAERSDAVSIHLALTPDTKGMIGKEFFRAMKPGSIFLNASRGDVVDTAALTEAISSKDLRVGLDVYEDEPTGGEADFAQTQLAAKVSCTPHIGASTAQASEAIAAAVLDIISVFLSTGQPPNVVNVHAPTGNQVQLIVRHDNRVGVLATVFDLIQQEGISIEEVQNYVFQTNNAGSCALFLDKPPSQATIDKILADERVIGTTIQ